MLSQRSFAFFILIDIEGLLLTESVPIMPRQQYIDCFSASSLSQHFIKLSDSWQSKGKIVIYCLICISIIINETEHFAFSFCELAIHIFTHFFVGMVFSLLISRSPLNIKEFSYLSELWVAGIFSQTVFDFVMGFFLVEEGRFLLFLKNVYIAKCISVCLFFNVFWVWDYILKGFFCSKITF